MTSSDPDYFPKALPPDIITLRVRASTGEFGEHAIQSVTVAEFSAQLCCLLWPPSTALPCLLCTFHVGR